MRAKEIFDNWLLALIVQRHACAPESPEPDQGPTWVHAKQSANLPNLENEVPDLLDQFFFCDPVVIKTICCRSRAKRMINESNMTGWVEKIWTGIKTLNSNKRFLLKYSIK